MTNMELFSFIHARAISQLDLYDKLRQIEQNADDHDLTDISTYVMASAVVIKYC